MIRATTRDVICEALAEADTDDGKPMSSHVHLLSVTDAIVRGFAAEGIDLEAMVEEALACQTVAVDSAIVQAPTAIFVQRDDFTRLLSLATSRADTFASTHPDRLLVERLAVKA